MQVNENLTSDLTVVNLRDIGGAIIVTDNESGETGDVVAQTLSGQILIQWRGFVDSENHQEFELASLLAPNVKVKKVDASGEEEFKSNPFGLFEPKKKFYVDFWADEEFYQTLITAKNKSAAVQIAKRGYEDFELDSVEEA